MVILVALLAALFMGGTAGKKTARLDTLLPVALRARARAVLEPLGAFKGHSALFWRAGVLALLLQVNNVTFYWMLSEALSLDVDFATFFIIAPLAIFIMTLPISINGIGLRETAFVLLLGMTGVAGEQALALAWMEFGLILMLGGVGGLVYITRPERPMPPRTA
ncbi:hypothetical protein OCH239_13005 [Roseivivax halodurans JCM 10272]|uniref:Flippase-like domain-containing protein n=1 Tax=Roseivivax halodurans JCM 10272 TaxID=1449350 RepID=X7EDH3_9RHOB|nr:hypothetical protein OCH239_13005 [Roseivivax halodurans JCM 10272]